MLQNFISWAVFISMQVGVGAANHADKTPPKVSISTPTKGARLQYLKPLYGWVKDSGSGVARVTVSIRRLSKGRVFYWDGYEWSRSPTKTASEFWYLAHLFGNRWRFDYVPTRVAPEQGHNSPTNKPPLVSGVYTFQVTARDRVGNTHSVSRIIKIGADVKRPAIKITHPNNRAVISDFGLIKGVAQDKRGSGVASIRCKISYDGKQWDGSIWHTPYSGDVWMSESMAFSKGQWHLSGHLPRGANLKRGIYTIEVAATDRAGNDSSQIVRFDPNGGYFYQVFPKTITVQIR